jgi:tRNA-specific 2-thiouridylase
MEKLNLKNRVVVAMSGGVDSSVSASLLKRAGFDVIGIMLKFWKDGQSSANRCCSIESENLARLVAKKIGIPFYVINVEKEFKKKVVDYFLQEYKDGHTPNPCVVCNKEIKFGFLINKALSLGADFVATGHYVQTSLSSEFFASVRPASAGLTQFAAAGSLCETMPSRLARYASNSPLRLFCGKDAQKDQSYFLWQLSQEQLKHILFPVGNLTKSEVRKLAKKFKLPTAETPESQEVCFISGQTNDFLKKYLGLKSGEIKVLGSPAQNFSKKILAGKHQGLWFYTIGQRKGLPLQQGPWYVVGKDFSKNILVVSKNIKDLYRKELIATNVNWLSPRRLPIIAQVKIRYKSKLAGAKILANGKNSVKIIFNKKQKSITPGQSAVFYLPAGRHGKGDQLLGGGIIC